jgi:cellulose synthase/poly-beta-1,6-N-acetylglucosamine synthase-like glycosyltransferase
MSTESILATTFWFGCCVTLYAYFGFPALMALLTATRRRDRGGVEPPGSPTVVTVIVAAYNEEQSIGQKIRNVLASDYPPELLDVLVVSDASTDGTDAIARSFEADGVRLIVQERRRGKTAGLTRAIALARGEVVVFTDANATFPSDTIGTLVGHFRQPSIGLVTGYTKYVATSTGEIAEATNAYTSLERVIKAAESRWGCCVGADGAVFAMRRSLYQPLDDDDINDFVMPLGVIEDGYQCVLAEDAFCSENPGKSLESEFRRQTRITNRTLRAIWRRVHLLNPVKFGLFSFFLFSHKLVRFLVPVLLMLSGVSLALLARTSAVYLAATIGAAAAVILATRVQSKPTSAFPWSLAGRLLYLLNTFLTINIAILLGWWHFVRGQSDTMWQHDRLRGENT